MKNLTANDIIDTILDILGAREANGHPHVKTSPTTVCEELEKRGFNSMRGGFARRKPDRDTFDFVWDVACENFSCSIHGNTRCIRF
jgi:hypothetical protein